MKHSKKSLLEFSKSREDLNLKKPRPPFLREEGILQDVQKSLFQLEKSMGLSRQALWEIQEFLSTVK